uniref:Thioredoxin domain-containing protein n=1 Tax=Stomoxys calcitrans TaxID=35570 RepID=A0A1I8P6X3_STOCA
MESVTTEEDDFFKAICIDSDSDSSDYGLFSDPRTRLCRKRIPLPPPEPRKVHTEQYINFETYIKVNCENRLKILDRSTFPHITRPILIAFNHFREFCFQQSKWLDRLYHVALKYGDRIEFIVADYFDMDLMYTDSNPIDFYCYLVSPENESPNVYAIDERKRIHEHFDAYKTEENLTELCENFLKGSLYLSEPIPEKNETMVKICVHQNYDELVENSAKDIFLIVGLGGYITKEQYEPDYEQLANEVKDLNVDIVYIDGDKNYVPFKFCANCYPTLLFIPHQDKEDFIPYLRGPRDTQNVREFIKDNLGPAGEARRKMEKLKSKYKPFTLPEEVQLNFEGLKHYIKETFPQSLEPLDRSTFHKPKRHRCVIIYFMDFIGHGIEYFLKHLQIIYQVAQAKYHFGVEYLIADLKDMDILYPFWYKKYLENGEIDKSTPHVFAIDRASRICRIQPFNSPSTLFYYSYSLVYKGFFFSQPLNAINRSNFVKTSVALNLLTSIEKSSTDILLTIYWGTYKESNKILNIIEEIAPQAHDMHVKLIVMDAKLNYVPLKFSSPKYPIHFFIPHKTAKVNTIRYSSTKQSKGELLEILKTNSNFVRSKEN